MPLTWPDSIVGVRSGTVLDPELVASPPSGGGSHRHRTSRADDPGVASGPGVDPAKVDHVCGKLGKPWTNRVPEPLR